MTTDGHTLTSWVQKTPDVAETVTQAFHFGDVGDQIVVELPPLLREGAFCSELQQPGRRSLSLGSLPHRRLVGVVNVAQIGPLDGLKMG